MIIKVFTDGGSKGNPGPAAIGIVFYADNKILFHYREDIGVATNNVAEYRAVLKAFEIIIQKALSFKFQVSQVDFYSDSQLVVRQLSGIYKVKDPGMRALVNQIKEKELLLGIPVFYTSIPREKNQVADNLVNGLEPKI